MSLRFLTAGESHGPGLTAILEGLPSGLVIDPEAVTEALRRRQGGYGRSSRMRLEKDRAQFTSGVRHGRTLGSPLAVYIPNLDHENWRHVMAPFGDPPEPPKRVVVTPRPGHADLAGGIKHGFTDLRNVLERASARETAARVALGAVAQQLLAVFDVRVFSHTRSLGSVEVTVQVPEEMSCEDAAKRARRNDLACLDEEAYSAMVDAIQAARREGDTLGGVVEVLVWGLVPGLGSHVHWDRKLDARLGQALLSVPAVKGVEIGPAFENARLRGSQVHDAIQRDPAAGLRRVGNRAGGLEGGITNGQTLCLRGAMKPLSTLQKPLESVDLQTGQPSLAAVERSDVCAVPACGVVAESMVALVVAQAWLEKFGGDTMAEVQSAHARYVEEVDRSCGSS